MRHELTNAEKIRRLPWNIALSATNNVFATLTFFGSAFVLFLNELGFDNAQIGFLLALLPLCGVVALFIAPWVARFGYKRTFVTFFGIRKIVTAGLLLTPWVMGRYGMTGTRLLITAIMFGFALCRAISETGLYPWAQEYIPNSIRGKHAALNDMIARITGLLAVAVGGYILGLSTGIGSYMLLFEIALVFGVIAVWSATHLPGGAPTHAQRTSFRHLAQTLRDRNFILYLVGLSLLTLANAPLAFLPIFMQNQVGLSDSAIVWLQIGTIIGGFLTTYFLGWASDRYGSKPVMLFGLYVKMLLPIGWLLLPRASSLSLAIALTIAGVWGVAEIAWALGSGRLFFVQVVPAEKKSQYMAVFYATAGIVGAVSQILSGNLLDLFAGIHGQFLIFPVDPFTPLLFATLILTALSTIVFGRIHAGSDIGMGEFANLFVHGNPVLALESMVRYYRAKDERATVVGTERMGTTKSPLTVAELLEALKDPRFNVRFESIISIARMNADPRLVEALCGILDGTELSLSVIAAWALGRMGDEHALPSLRNGLNSDYRSIRAHSARSLGTLGDMDVAPLLLERLRQETDKGLRIAYASALGNLRYEPALEMLLVVLDSIENEGARMELALALARIVGDEPRFIRLLRSLRQDRGTTAAQVLSACKRRLDKVINSDLKTLIDQCADSFARDEVDQAVMILSRVIWLLPATGDRKSCVLVLQECAHRLERFGATRDEYILLTLHMLQTWEM